MTGGSTSVRRGGRIAQPWVDVVPPAATVGETAGEGELHVKAGAPLDLSGRADDAGNALAVPLPADRSGETLTVYARLLPARTEAEARENWPSGFAVEELFIPIASVVVP